MILATARIAPCSPSDRLAVRHGRPVAAPDGNWVESFAPDAFLPFTARKPTVLTRHDGTEVGYVSVIGAGREWIEADLILDDEARDLAVVGAPVSIDARSLHSDDHHLAGVRRHRMARLEHVCFLSPDERPVYGARACVTAVRELSVSPAAGAAASERVPVAGEIIVETGRRLIRREGIGQVLGVR